MVEIILGILAMAGCFCFFMLYRNHWVCKVRLEVLNNPSRTMIEQLQDHDKLVSYNEMMSIKNCFIFDINKFKSK